MPSVSGRTLDGDRAKQLTRRVAHQVWRLVVTTVASCLRYRVTGLAAEAAFFAVVSVPPLLFALAGGIGYVADQFSPAQVEDVRAAIIELSRQVLTDRAVREVIQPTVTDVLGAGRFDVISIGFVLALWSGSRALNVFVEKYGAKYHKAATCLIKDREALLAFYDFPAEHWDHLRTSNPIESVFATVRHRTVRTKGALSQKTARLMVYKLVQAAAKGWRRLKGANQLPMVIEGVKFTDGVLDAKNRAA